MKSCNHFWPLPLLIAALMLSSLCCEGQDAVERFIKSGKKIKDVPPHKVDLRLEEKLLDDGVLERQIFYYPSNKLYQQKLYKDDIPTGTWRYYSEEGELTRVRDFSKLKYLPKDSLPALTKSIEEFIEMGGIMPEFPGGEAGLMRHLASSVKYPTESRNNMVTGTVLISFVVDTDGKVEPSYILNQGLDAYTDLVVWEVVEALPPWKPAQLDGELVKAAYNLPIRFSLR